MSSSPDPYDRYGRRREEQSTYTFTNRPRSFEGIKEGDKLETPKAFYIIPAVLGLGALGIGFLGRRIVSGAGAAAKSAQQPSDAAGRGLFGFRRYYYDGGFAPEMTKREAAQILGCRESATKDVILQKYRKLMKSNHPDLGGSRYLGTKINEAKAMLSKTAR
mmetsp:Transcript_13177/g.18271  ORF Transcript_13177/g.18271 Transcript_13177/m.18271 type:complete len:162 (+) Transcript_13177:2-487(+)